MKFILIFIIAVLQANSLALSAVKPPIISIFYECDGISIQTNKIAAPALILAIWQDGNAIWSMDRKRGGPPYRTAQLNLKHVRESFRQLEEKYAGTDNKKVVAWRALGSHYISVAIKGKRASRRLESWHELFNDIPGLVVIDGNVLTLNGRSRREILKKASAEYKKFLSEWNGITETAWKLIPKK
jgi:hypothetical protein